MTGAHEQTRLWKPADRATQVSAVDSKNLELIALDTAHPACGIYRRSIGGHHIGIPESSKPRFAFGKFANTGEGYPGEVGVGAAPCNRREHEAHDWQRKGRRHQAVEDHSDLHE